MASCATSSEGLMRQVSRQPSSGDVFSEELEFLQHVYFDEMTYDSRSYDQTGHTLHFRVTPSTGDDKEKQYVYLMLNIFVPKEYPLVSPKCTIGQSRGLSDTRLRSIQEGLSHKCEELLGCQMIYELVEFTKDCLTDNNLPSGECVICLNGFQESEEFKKTDCYHYFHLPCLAGYLEFYHRQVREDLEEDSKKDMMLRKKTRQLECPVCRVPMATPELIADLSHEWLTSSPADALFIPSLELRVWQKKMKELLWKQRLKGGVIDQSQSDVIDGSWVGIISPKTKGYQSDTSKSLSTQDSKPPSVSKSPQILQKSQRKHKNGFFLERGHCTSSSPHKLESRNTANSGPTTDKSRSRTKEGYYNEPRYPRQRRNRHPNHRADRTVEVSSSAAAADSHDAQTKSSREHHPNTDKPQRRRNGNAGVNGRSRTPQNPTAVKDRPSSKNKEHCLVSKQGDMKMAGNSEASEKGAHSTLTAEQ